MAEVTRMNRKAFIELGERLKDLDALEVRAGWFASSVYENGTPVAYVASIQEFGVPEKGIPARPFVRPTIASRQQVWNDDYAAGARAILEGRYTSREVLDLLGAKIAGDVAKTITTIWTPPLKQATIKARARRYASRKGLVTKSLEKPLIDSGKMFDEVFNDTVNHQVVKAGSE